MHVSTKFYWIFLFFYLEDIALGSPKLHAIKFFSQTTSHKNLVILFIGAELAAMGGGADSAPPPPSWARNSEPHSQAGVKDYVKHLASSRIFDPMPIFLATICSP